MGVAAPGRDHLQALCLADAVLGVEDAATRAGHVEEALERGLARVAARRHEDEDLARLSVLFAAERQQMGQQLQRHVLEGERRPVPELQGMRPAAHAHERRDGLAVKPRAIGAGDSCAQLLLPEIGQKAGEHRVGALLIAHRNEREEIRLREGGELCRDIQAAVGRKPAQDGHRGRNSGSAARRKHLHKDPPTKYRFERMGPAAPGRRLRGKKPLPLRGKRLEGVFRSGTCGCSPARWPRPR